MLAVGAHGANSATDEICSRFKTSSQEDCSTLTTVSTFLPQCAEEFCLGDYPRLKECNDKVRPGGVYRVVPLLEGQPVESQNARA